MAKLYSYLKVSQLEPHLVVKSHVLSTIKLVWFRTIAAGICYVVLVDLVYHFTTPLAYFKFLTGFGFLGITAYFTISMYFSWKSIINPPTYKPFDGFHWGFQLAYTLLYQSCCVLSCIVSLVYWSLIAPNEITTLNSTQLFTSIAMHAFNVILMALEMLFSSNPFILTHMFVFIPIIMLYVPYKFMIHQFDNKWPYFFFDYKEVPILFSCVVVGVIVLMSLLHVLFFHLHTLRDVYLGKQTFSSRHAYHLV
ncbi:hypothetical protein DSO57_1034113 [Entomophthora muscae]|uniref:Uncharacterized protein n=1 Tax=Entomophthora muscae TaxID=34485 RepID=A0ACC2REP7_9FUNG|nr:hypothetical protein DSO57_1034113 [Entomophthora muscae]